MGLKNCQEHNWHGLVRYLPELVAVKIGEKPAVRFPLSEIMSPDKTNLFKEICSKMGIKVGYSSYRIKPPYSKNDILPTNSTKGDFFIYLSLSNEVIESAKKYELVDDYKFGEIMGYPKCCIKHFIDMNQSDSEDYYHEVFNHLKSNKKFDWHTNYLLRWTTDYYLLSYFTCSFDCTDSIVKARKILEGIYKYDGRHAKKIEYHLKLPILFNDSMKGSILHNWNKLKGVVFDGVMNDNKVTYQNHFSIYRGGYFPQFKDTDKVMVDKKRIFLFKHNKLKHSIIRRNKYDGLLFGFE
jgi:hypothetical protein